MHSRMNVQVLSSLRGSSKCGQLLQFSLAAERNSCTPVRWCRLFSSASLPGSGRDCGVFKTSGLVDGGTGWLRFRQTWRESQLAVANTHTTQVLANSEHQLKFNYASFGSCVNEFIYEYCTESFGSTPYLTVHKLQPYVAYTCIYCTGMATISPKLSSKR